MIKNAKKMISKKWETKTTRTVESRTELTDSPTIRKETESSVQSCTIEEELLTESSVVEGPITVAGVSPSQLERNRQGRGETSTCFVSGCNCNRILENPGISESNSREFGLDDQAQEETAGASFNSASPVGDNADAVSMKDKYSNDIEFENANHRDDSREFGLDDQAQKETGGTPFNSASPVSDNADSVSLKDKYSNDIIEIENANDRGDSRECGLDDQAQNETGGASLNSASPVSDNADSVSLKDKYSNDIIEFENANHRGDSREFGLDDQAQKETGGASFNSASPVGDNADAVSMKDKYSNDNIQFESAIHSSNRRITEDINHKTIYSEGGFERGNTSESDKFADDKEYFRKITAGLHKGNSESRFRADRSAGDCCLNMNTLGAKSKINSNTQGQGKNNFDLKLDYIFMPEDTDDSASVKQKSTGILYKDSSVRRKVPKLKGIIKKRVVRQHNTEISKHLANGESKEKVTEHEDYSERDLQKKNEEECVCWSSAELENCGGIDKESLKRSVRHLISYFESLKNSNAKRLNSLNQMAKAIETSGVNTGKAVVKEPCVKEPVNQFPIKYASSVPENYVCKTGKAKKRVGDPSSSPKEKKFPKKRVTFHSSVKNPQVSRISPCDLCLDANVKCTAHDHEYGINNNIELPKERRLLLIHDTSFDPTMGRNRVITESYSGDGGNTITNTAGAMAQNAKEYGSSSEVNHPEVSKTNEPFFTGNSRNNTIRKADNMRSLTIPRPTIIGDGYWMSGKRNQKATQNIGKLFTWRPLLSIGLVLLTALCIFVHESNLNFCDFF